MDAVTIHYHGTPISPRRVLNALAGRHFCVSFARPDDIETCHRIGQSVMHDNGAFSVWRKSRQAVADWQPFYAWVEPRLGNAVHWAVIPDEIDAGSQTQDALVRQWPFGARGAPVWHMDEPVNRLLALSDAWPRVCLGSTAEYAVVGSDAWRRRMDEVFDALAQRHRLLPWLHMLRGMQALPWGYPFASVDSTDVAQNHNRCRAVAGPLADAFPRQDVPEIRARRMADRWDAMQCPGRWVRHPVQAELAAIPVRPVGGG